MTKRDLVVQIAEEVGLTQSQIKRVVEGVLKGISRALADGEKVELRDFGIFKVKARKGRMGRNPRSGEEVPIEAKKVATFKPGKALKEAVK